MCTVSVCLSASLSLSLLLPACAVQRLGTFGPLRCGEMYALDRLLREARVLELIRRVAKDTSEGMNQPEEGERSVTVAGEFILCHATHRFRPLFSLCCLHRL